MIVIGLAERVGNVRTKARELDTCISLRRNSARLKIKLEITLSPRVNESNLT